MSDTRGQQQGCQPCHAEPIRFAQGKLREAARCPSRETLRCAQGDMWGKRSDIVWQRRLMPIGADKSAMCAINRHLQRFRALA
jgi:hypothetical protein